eukprot:TRINITY_DN1056_c0_g1_i1.p1 TRINITY_DN1056_c0_g1~~TRINITY_DN1056_c0_g1_i1.p1  ORF type:complete len:488 (-),score=75.86 TRINITY_DN1056_c0_g1_i1:1213-2676(-)
MNLSQPPSKLAFLTGLKLPELKVISDVARVYGLKSKRKQEIVDALNNALSESCVPCLAKALRAKLTPEQAPLTAQLSYYETSFSHVCVEAKQLVDANPFYQSIGAPLCVVENTALRSEQRVRLSFVADAALLARKDDVKYLLRCYRIGETNPAQHRWPDAGVTAVVNTTRVAVTPRKLSLVVWERPLEIAQFLRPGTNMIDVHYTTTFAVVFMVHAVQVVSIDGMVQSVKERPTAISIEAGRTKVKSSFGHQGDELSSQSAMISMRCPLTMKRIEHAGRATKCTHLGCFDLKTYLMFCQQSLKWSCPLCSKQAFFSDLVYDNYFQSLLSVVSGDKAELLPSGDWRNVGPAPVKRKEPAASLDLTEDDDTPPAKVANSLQPPTAFAASAAATVPAAAVTSFDATVPNQALEDMPLSSWIDHISAGQLQELSREIDFLEAQPPQQQQQQQSQQPVNRGQPLQHSTVPPAIPPQQQRPRVPDLIVIDDDD